MTSKILVFLYIHVQAQRWTIIEPTLLILEQSYLFFFV